MKIKINQTESYHFELPEEIDKQTFLGFYERLKAIKTLLTSTSELTETITEQDKNSKYKKRQLKYKVGLSKFVEENQEQVAKLFFNPSPENNKRLKILFENNGVNCNRSNISMKLMHLHLKREQFKEK